MEVICSSIEMTTCFCSGAHKIPTSFSLPGAQTVEPQNVASTLADLSGERQTGSERRAG